MPKGWLCVSGQNQMCHLYGWLKLFLKKCGGKKNKKHSGGQRVGLDAVLLQYGLYFFGHLSKWFVFVLMFKFWSVGCLWNGRPTIGYNLLIGDTKYRITTKYGKVYDTLYRFIFLATANYP